MDTSKNMYLVSKGGEEEKIEAVREFYSVAREELENNKAGRTTSSEADGTGP